ncbi:TPA: hypothetical protein NO902_004178 [Klebsiella variicola subsp. variicola]|uniref:hypothetical protein n=1 Tax=Klebsiella TaxID=570 RepID=UPI0025573324|nr:hypothetical protein [Klebsiella variicola]MEC6023929.1 hypothetical protein [Klebsiella variicola]HCI4641866.1 hypothetical protein [Klebsiella variicola subsp. variicola]HCI6450723.1 hypothetical protein [Klebsiella variicola subsp. variicola]
MKDYKESILSGIAAAKQAAINKMEISSVLEALSNQVQEISQSKASFGIGDFQKEPINLIERATMSVAEMMMASQGKKATYEALAIFNHKGRNGIEVAQWEKGANGYPCIIKYNGSKFVCSNKSELENSLAELIKEIKVGEAILEQMKIHDEQLDEGEEPA